MNNHQMIYKLACNREKGGIINDHVSVERMPGPRRFIVIQRSGFDISEGYFTRNFEVASGDDSLGLSLEEAIERGLAKAKEDSIALFLKEYCSKEECEEGIDDGRRNLLYAPSKWVPLYYH